MLDLADSGAEIPTRGAGHTALRMRVLNGLSRWTETIDLGTDALVKLKSLKNRRMVGEIHGHLGTAYLRVGLVLKAEVHFRAAIHTLTWELSDPIGALRQQRRLGVMLASLGQWQRARFEIERAIESADELGAAREGGGLRINLATILLKSGFFPLVPSVLDQADRLLEATGRKKSVLLSTLIRGNYLRLTGQPSKALSLLEPALVTTREQRYLREEAICLEYIGDCHLSTKEYRRALEYYEAGMRIAEATAPRGDLVPELCQRIAEANVHLGDPNTAILLCERGIRVARDLGDRYEECATQRVYAMAQRAAGNPRKALRIADEGIELGRSYEIPYELARALGWAGETRLQDSSPEEQVAGRRQLWEARAIFDRIGLTSWARAMERLLGLDVRPEPSKDDPGYSTILGMPDLDRAALRFGIVTCDARVREAISIAQGVGPSLIPVLITGESGVGKELLAQALHETSDRRSGPFVPVNCAAVTLGLMESEFFGHERGAFTGAITSREGLLASADRGTLFLDEVAELPPTVQASLLRVLETGEVRPVGRDEVRRVDIRVVAATNGKLEDCVERGTFRQDLFYRLNGVRLSLPPLRDREDDIRALFRFFWGKATAAAAKTLHLTEDVEGMLCAYHWPGNVRELRHEVARVVALAPTGSLIGCEAFLVHEQRKAAVALRSARDRHEENLEERELILQALRAHRGNKAEAARSLGGMKRTTLIYKMERLGIRPEEYQVKG